MSSSRPLYLEALEIGRDQNVSFNAICKIRGLRAEVIAPKLLDVTLVLGLLSWV